MGRHGGGRGILVPRLDGAEDGSVLVDGDARLGIVVHRTVGVHLQQRAHDVQQIDGIWVSNKLVVRTMRGSEMESETVLQWSAVKFNDPAVSEQVFSERRLEQGL